MPQKEEKNNLSYDLACVHNCKRKPKSKCSKLLHKQIGDKKVFMIL